MTRGRGGDDDGRDTGLSESGHESGKKNKVAGRYSFSVVKYGSIPLRLRQHGYGVRGRGLLGCFLRDGLGRLWSCANQDSQPHAEAKAFCSCRSWWRGVAGETCCGIGSDE